MSQADISNYKNKDDGQFRRGQSTFRNFIEKGGRFAPEKGRYHLYVSYACPWAHRTLIVRKLKGLEDHIAVTVVSPRMGLNGWPFASADSFPGAEKDPHNNAQHIKDIYLKIDPDMTARFTVPMLWDTKEKTIVNNESSEIIRMLNSEFETGTGPDLYPEKLRSEIDDLNEWVYNTVNNGVYKCGFATSQEAYESNITPLFKSLDRLEKILEGKDYLVGNTLTEADVRLYTTIVRFDPVYVGHFKCNIGTIRHNYPNLNRWLKNLYWKNDAFKSTTNFEHIKTHYYWSHPHINPTRVVPVGPNQSVEPL